MFFLNIYQNNHVLYMNLCRKKIASHYSIEHDIVVVQTRLHGHSALLWINSLTALIPPACFYDSPVTQ